jgi:hypothetical protein
MIQILKFHAKNFDTPLGGQFLVKNPVEKCLEIVSGFYADCASRRESNLYQGKAFYTWKQCCIYVKHINI